MSHISFSSLATFVRTFCENRSQLYPPHKAAIHTKQADSLNLYGRRMSELRLELTTTVVHKCLTHRSIVLTPQDGNSHKTGWQPQSTWKKNQRVETWTDNHGGAQTLNTQNRLTAAIYSEEEWPSWDLNQQPRWCTYTWHTDQLYPPHKKAIHRKQADSFNLFRRRMSELKLEPTTTVVHKRLTHRSIVPIPQEPVHTRQADGLNLFGRMAELRLEPRTTHDCKFTYVIIEASSKKDLAAAPCESVIIFTATFLPLCVASITAAK